MLKGKVRKATEKELKEAKKILEKKKPVEKPKWLNNPISFILYDSWRKEESSWGILTKTRE